ncbi:MAG: DUF721 domain-containing protein [Treponema sp.]|nr:DUF721 domain-containing protein [Candidatus Treponema equifaecale]
MFDNNVVKASFMIDAAFAGIERRKAEESNSILKYWREVVESIKSNARNGENLGKNLASHSRVIDLKNGILLVEADHPAWIQTLKIYQKYIITGLCRKVNGIEISSLAFRLRGTNFELQAARNEENSKKLQENLQKKLNEEQQIYENLKAQQSEDAESEKPKEMPANLREILDRLKNDMLTKNN